MASGNECPIWGTPADFMPTTRDGRDVESARAGGRYFISGTAAATMSRVVDNAIKSRLTTWLVDQRRLGIDRPEVMSTAIEEAERLPPLAVHERADRLLTFIDKQSPTLGKRFCFSLRYLNQEQRSWLESEVFAQMKAWSESTAGEPTLREDHDEVMYLINFLARKGLLEEKVAARGANGQGAYSGKENYFEYLITPDGHAHLAELKAKVANSTQAFVAMWFNDSLDEAYAKGIAPGIEDAGYKPLRIDRKDHNNKIDDEIIAEIRRSRFLVVDFTQGDSGARGGVYYEAGFAHGLTMPVIFTCRADAIDKVHFDTRQYNHITWTTPDELRKRLGQRIAATIGDGPLKNRKV